MTFSTGLPLQVTGKVEIRKDKHKYPINMDKSRRDFVRSVLITSGGALAMPAGTLEETSLHTGRKTVKSKNPMIGMQIDPEAIRGQDIGQVCDEMQKLAPVNAFHYFYRDVDVKRGENYHGGTEFRCEKAMLDSMGRDTIDRMYEAASSRGIDIYMGGGELYWGNCIEKFPQACQIDCFGKTNRRSCMNIPEWRAFQKAAHVDLLKQHPYLSGFLFMHERNGPMARIFRPLSWWSEAFDPGPVCFCEHCCRKGEELGIDVDNARNGFREIVKLFKEKDSFALRDGAMIAFYRLLCEYPEVLAWEKMQWDTVHEYRKELTDAMRDTLKNISIGCHFQHSGARYKKYVDQARTSFLMDCDEKTTHLLFSAWFNRDPENGREMFGDNPKEQSAFGPDWVEAEVRRIAKGFAPRPTNAGLGIGVPGGEKTETPELIADCTEACFRGGTEGIIISRHYSEIKPELLRACGDVIRDHIA